MSAPSHTPAQNRAGKQLSEVESEIERWESLLSEPETRWESFSQNRSQTTGPLPVSSSAAAAKVRFEDSVADITANQPYAGPDMSDVAYEGPRGAAPNLNMSVNEQLTSTMEQVRSHAGV